MARQVKSFGDHSQRWQREARRQGISPRRWDNWRKLSPKSRADTNPTDYGKGKSVAAARKENKQESVFKAINEVWKDKPKYRPRTVRHNISQMTNAQMNKILSFNTTSDLRAFLIMELIKVTRDAMGRADCIYFYQ